ncbi:MAG TPA: hypothetical protein VGG41_14620 [Solirubrobacteraceae bacterium]|jgi:hypothetical protein
MRNGSPRISALLPALVASAVLGLATVASAATPFTGVSGSGGSSSAQTTTTATATTAPPIKIPSTTSSGGLPSYAYIIIGVVVVILFGVIVYWIRRDAHLHAPRHAARDLDRGRGTIAPQTERRKRNRAKAKAARRARRRS